MHMLPPAHGLDAVCAQDAAVRDPPPSPLLMPPPPPSLPSPSPALPSPPTSLSLGRSLPSSSLPPALAAATLHRWSVALAVATQTAPNESATPLAATLAATIVAPAVIAAGAAIAVDRCPVVMSGRTVRSI